MQNIFFMPLRAGSKGIPGKNYKNFFGKPLFSWGLDSIVKSNLATQIWVATDCIQTKSILINEFPYVRIFDRSSENAQDTSPTIDVVLEFLSKIPFKTEDNFILVQATSPLTSIENFADLMIKMKTGKYDSYIACTRLKRFRWSDNGIPLDYSFNHKPRRQEYEGFLVETGAFYASTIGAILHTKQLLSGKIGIVELGNESLIDIDEPADWYLGEAYLNFKLNGKS